MTNESPEPSPAAPRVTLKDIARAVGITHGAVSLALRNNPRIGEATRQRVQAVAKEMGYQPNAMAAGLAHFKRTSTVKPTHSVLAWLNFWPDPKKLRGYREFEHYWQGAVACAEKFGYRLDEFICNDPAQLRRYSKIFSTRGISGILIPPGPLGEEWKDFPWEHYSIVRLSRSAQEPFAHTVTADQMSNTLLAYDKMAEEGYERIGFVGASWRARLFGAGYLWALASAPWTFGPYSPESLEPRGLRSLQLPPLLFWDTHENLNARNERTFLTWFKKTKPDAILCDRPEVPGWLEKAGYRIPEDIALATTSVLDGHLDSGIYQNPEEVGRVAVLVLISLIQDNDRGIPQNPREILIKGRWQKGTSLPQR